jgi:GT2 family glycosyltransferase
METETATEAAPIAAAAPAAAEPQVTIIVVPRERFGVSEESLASIYANTAPPFALVYVNGRAPAELTRQLDEEAARRRFRHVKVDRFLSPNEARNIGLAHATTRYVVFIDNDVVCAPGWLDALVACAEETGADVVTPLTCHGSPAHSTVHQAGGEFAPDPRAFFAQPHGERKMVEVMHLQGAKVADVRAQLSRSQTQCCEFHCVLVRRSIFDRIGPLDEGMLATKEHIDFCMSVIQAGGTVWLEPASLVTYFFPTRQRAIVMRDWPFFLVRWSPEWQHRSMLHFQKKWGLASEGYLQDRRALYGWRHYEGIIKPVMRKVPVIGKRRGFQQLGGRLFGPVVGIASRLMVARTERKRRPAA